MTAVVFTLAALFLWLAPSVVSSSVEENAATVKTSSTLPCELCPLWAQQHHCGPMFQQDQTLLFRNRRLSPDCPLSCHACSSNVDDEKIEDVVREYSRHCVDLDIPETEDAWKPGDPNVMYERILSDFPQYQPTVLSRDPWIIQLENFIAPQEAMVMIDETRLEVMKGTGEAGLEEANEEGGVCHSTQAWCNPICLQRPEMQSVARKVEHLVDLPWKHAEPIHFIEYTPGQKYGKHTDHIPEEMETMHGPRLFTILFYLNDIEKGLGGETCFPDVDVCVTPKTGRAVIWANVLNDQPWAAENRTWHEANEIEYGYKYASTVWYHLRDYLHAEKLNCVYTMEEDIREELEELEALRGGDDWYDDEEEDYDEEEEEDYDEEEYGDDWYDYADY